MIGRYLALGLLFLIPLIGSAKKPIHDHIPSKLDGVLIVYRVGFTQCSMFISNKGMTKANVIPECTLLPAYAMSSDLLDESGYPFEILYTIPTAHD